MGDSAPLAGTLVRQFDLATKLARYHIDALTTEECMWRPSAKGPHVAQSASGAWRADWPENEDIDIGAPSIAWLTWHLGFWLSMAIDHNFAKASLAREDVFWPGDAASTRVWLLELCAQWRTHIEGLSDLALCSSQRTHWPYRDRPFADLVAWANIELAKNASEIGYARLLYASRSNA